MSELRAKLFDIFMIPLEKITLNNIRKELIPKASGRILEIGAGTGRNFNYYTTKNIDKLTVMDLEFNKAIKNHPLNNKIKIDYIAGDAETLPFENNTFNSVVATLIFCSIDNAEKALSEVYRVLKPGGKLYFIEHVLPEGKHCRHVVNSFNNTWKKIGKCNINRETFKLIEVANFKVTNYERIGNKYLIFIKGIGIK